MTFFNTLSLIYKLILIECCKIRSLANASIFKYEEYHLTKLSSLLAILVIEPHSFPILHNTVQLILKILCLHLTRSLQLQISLPRHYYQTSRNMLYLSRFYVELGSLLYDLVNRSYLYPFLVLLR